MAATASLGWQVPSATKGPKSPSVGAKPVLIEMPYPKSAHTAAHYRWPMKFEITVDKKGRVSKVKSVEHQQDIEAYVDAVRRARFKPAVLDGIAHEVTFVFTIHQPEVNRPAPAGAER